MLDFLFDGAAGNHLVHKHRFFLPYPISSVGGLVFCCRVPPGVVVNHSVGFGQVQAYTTRLKTDQKYLQFAALKVFDRCTSIPCLTGEQGVINVALFQLGLDQAQHGGELGKQQNASPLRKQFFEHHHQAVEFARGAAFFWRVVADQAQVAAHLAQFEQGFQDDDLAAAYTFARNFIAHFFVHRQAHGFVHVPLRFVEINPVDDLGFWW